MNCGYTLAQSSLSTEINPKYLGAHLRTVCNVLLGCVLQHRAEFTHLCLCMCMVCICLCVVCICACACVCVCVFSELQRQRTAGRYRRSARPRPTRSYSCIPLSFFASTNGNLCASTLLPTAWTLATTTPSLSGTPAAIWVWYIYTASQTFYTMTGYEV